jgi:hypothetical protein
MSWKRLCQKLRILKTTCLRVLHDNFEFRKYYLKWVPHAMTENETQCLVTCSEELLQVVRHAKEANFEHLLTGDEHGSITRTFMIRLGLHREPLFGVERHGKFRPKMSGFNYLVDVQHPNGEFDSGLRTKYYHTLSG